MILLYHSIEFLRVGLGDPVGFLRMTNVGVIKFSFLTSDLKATKRKNTSRVCEYPVISG